MLRLEGDNLGEIPCKRVERCLKTRLLHLAHGTVRHFTLLRCVELHQHQFVRDYGSCYLKQIFNHFVNTIIAGKHVPDIR